MRKLNIVIPYTQFIEFIMDKKLEKQLKDNRIFYDNFLKITLYSTIGIIILLAILTIFLV